MAQPLSSLTVQITELALSTVLGSGYLGTRQVENRRLRGCAMAALIGRLGNCCRADPYFLLAPGSPSTFLGMIEMLVQ